MLVIPAIDLRGGHCVRLRQGKFDAETVFDSDPVEVAMKWERQGARFLHLVDLDGARDGGPRNLDVVIRIREAVKIPMQLGGGIRTTADVSNVLDAGIDRAIVGTRAIGEPAWLMGLAERFPGRVALAVDVHEGRLALEGWVRDSEVVAADLIAGVQDWPLAAIVYTDISRDGMMEGPNIEATRGIAKTSRIPVIASGGITTVDDVIRLAELPLAGLVIGRSLYEGTLTLEQAIEAAGAAGQTDRR